MGKVLKTEKNITQSQATNSQNQRYTDRYTDTKFNQYKNNHKDRPTGYGKITGNPTD